MPRMIDLIRTSQVPVNLMQSAARGSLAVPAGETIEILVYLALHHKTFGQQARLTLAGWDENASLAVAHDPATSAEVLGYLTSLENLRPQLLPALAENPSVTEEALSKLASEGSLSVAQALMASARVMGSRELLRALQSNAALRPNEQAEITKRLAALGEGTQTPATEEVGAHDSVSHDPVSHDPVSDEALTAYLKVNAAELEAEKDKPFQPIGHIEDDAPAAVANETAPTSQTATTTETATPAAAAPAPTGATAPEAKSAPAKPAAAAAHHHQKKHGPPSLDERRESTLQRISKLDIKGRIALAMKGSKEERSILVRDGTKLVALAVLDSPKVTDGEVEGFAQQKNVLEAVLRQIPLKRRFAKNYAIMRNLVFNPRTPLDESLTLVKNLLIHDLKNLSGNKEVSETVRKLALRMFKQKMEKRTQG